MTLTGWRRGVSHGFGECRRKVSDNWKMCAMGERVGIEGRTLESAGDPSPEAMRLGCEFYVAMQERDGEKAPDMTTRIGQMPTIWRDGTDG